MKKNTIYLSAIILTLIVLANSCSSKKAVEPTTSTNSVNVKIQNFAFVPDTVIIKTGSTVNWTNVDAAPHTATDLGGSFDSGSLATNAAFNFTFAKAGTFTYRCTIHSMMKKAVVIVTN